MLEVMLRSWRYEVLMVRDGVAALDTLKEDPTLQLAVLDWMLPGMTGPQVCRAIRAYRGDAPTYLLLLTSRTERTDVITGLEAGADDYIGKPADPLELRARLHAGARVVEVEQRLASHIEQLEYALAQVQTLSGLLPICAYCKSIRDDSNYWHQFEAYITEHANVRFSHGICPKCLLQAKAELSDIHE
jgi:DNA-binding response OmpR family regulator